MHLNLLAFILLLLERIFFAIALSFGGGFVVPDRRGHPAHLIARM